MQNPWVTLGLVALVVVLLIVLWLRRPRHDRHLRAAPSIEEQVAGFVARDAELLGVLRRRGVDLNAPRHIDLHFLADTKETADALMRSLGAAYPDGKREVAGPLTAQGTTY